MGRHRRRLSRGRLPLPRGRRASPAPSRPAIRRRGEPLSYYVKNLALNTNVVAPLGLVVAPLLLGASALFASAKAARATARAKLAFVAPAGLWIATMASRAHKEERFLYPA